MQSFNVDCHKDIIDLAFMSIKPFISRIRTNIKHSISYIQTNGKWQILAFLPLCVGRQIDDHNTSIYMDNPLARTFYICVRYLCIMDTTSPSWFDFVSLYSLLSSFVLYILYTSFFSCQNTEKILILYSSHRNIKVYKQLHTLRTRKPFNIVHVSLSLVVIHKW